MNTDTVAAAGRDASDLTGTGMAGNSVCRALHRRETVLDVIRRLELFLTKSTG